MQQEIHKPSGLLPSSAGSLLLLGVVLLWGCTAHSAQSPVHKGATDAQSYNAISKVRMQTSTNEKLEALSAVSYDGEKFTAKVISHGCTRSSDFTVEHEVKEGRCSVVIQRSKPDMCRRAPMLAEMVIAWSPPSECAELELVVANPILVTGSQGVFTKRAK